MSVAILLRGFLGGDVPVRVEAYDGSALGPVGARTVLRLRSPDAIRRVLLSPGELGIARAYVAGDLDIDRGTIFDVLELRHTRTDLRLRPADLLAAARLLDLHRPAGWRRLRLPAPAEEARPRGRRHSKRRDAAAVTHHYDVSNAFYDIVLGLSMTYSCALWERPGLTLDRAQTAKYSRTLATGSATQDTDEARYLRRLARYVTALVGVGLEAVRPWTFHDYATLTSSAATFDQHVNPMLGKARAVLRHEFTTRTIGPPGSQPEYRLARDEPTWTRLRDTLRQQVLTDSAAPSR